MPAVPQINGLLTPQQRLSAMGPNGNTSFSAAEPALAFNSTDNQYLAVWRGEGTVDGELEIFAQRFDDEEGRTTGSVIRVSNMGVEGDSTFWAGSPAAAYIKGTRLYLIVWAGRKDLQSGVQIYGQFVDYQGTPQGPDDFVISSMSADGVANQPSVACDASRDICLVVWSGHSGDGDFEIYSQRINLQGVCVGNQHRISTMGQAGNINYSAFAPDVVYNSRQSQYFVVWYGVDDTSGQAPGEYEIFGQLLNSSGTEIAGDDLILSDTGPGGNPAFDAADPAVAWNQYDDEYFVVWSGENNPQNSAEVEIFGQRVSVDGLELGENDEQISRMGLDGSSADFAASPDVVHSLIQDEYLVVWHGDMRASGQGSDEIEVWGQRVDGYSGAKKREPIRMSFMGPNGSNDYRGYMPAAAYSRSNDRVGIVWIGDDNRSGMVDNEFEVFGSLFEYATDLQLTASVSTNPVAPGSAFQYLLHIVNAGPDAAVYYLVRNLGHGVHDPLDGLKSIIPLNIVRPGESADIALDVYAIAGFSGVVNSTFTVTTSTLDVLHGDNSASVSVCIGADSDNDAICDLADTDDDNDNLSDEQEAAAGTDPMEPDSDRDGVQDGQETVDGSNPNDRGSRLTALSSRFCYEWNGFLDMWNVAEQMNMTDHDLTVETTLYDSEGAAQSTVTYVLQAGRQQDLLIHDLAGWRKDAYGRLCSTVIGGNTGDLDGRVVYYRPAASGEHPFQFAFAMPFENGTRGRQYVPFNTFQPGLTPREADNTVANWIQTVNLEQSAKSGELRFYGQDGTLLQSVRLDLAAGARRDYPAHDLGRNVVGLVEWIPEDEQALFQVRNVRYFYDNPSGVNSFTAAFQLEARAGSGETLTTPLDASVGSAILELANTGEHETHSTVEIHAEDGSLLAVFDYALPPHSSQHLITDQLLVRGKGSARIRTEHGGSIIATSMEYGRSADGSLRWLYGIAAGEALGTVLRGSYNTYLSQGCRLVLTNSSDEEAGVDLTMTRYDGIRPLQGQRLSIPGNGVLDYDLCAADGRDVYGMLTMLPARVGVSAQVLRTGINDSYRFPTPVR